MGELKTNNYLRMLCQKLIRDRLVFLPIVLEDKVYRLCMRNTTRQG